MTNEESHTKHFEELCAGYVLHALDAEERDEFETMLGEATDDERILYQQMWSAANQMAYAVDKEEPPAELKDRLMTKIKEKQDEEGTQETVTSVDDASNADATDEGTNWSAMAIAASFALFIICLSLVFYSFNLSSTISDKKEVIADNKATITELKDEINKKDEMLAVLGSRSVKMVVMAGREVNPDGYGKVVWDPEKQQALLQVANLPTVPSDKDYQLWLIKDKKPISAGVFAVNNSSDSFFKIEDLAEADQQSASAFAITQEPKGGSKKPTGDMYLLGNINK